jgi:multimeric flavodoxin WrbA
MEGKMLDPGLPINVVGVMSSARVNGNTAVLVREALKGAAEAGASTTEIVLADYRIDFCAGCMRCMAEGRCAQPDDFEALRGRLTAAQGIILSSPTYAVAPCARMKALIDRMGLFEYFTSSAFGGKYVAGISTANRADAARKVARGLADEFASGIFQRGYISGCLGVSSTGNGVAQNAGALQQAHELGIKLVQDIRSKKTYPLQNPVAGLMNRFILRPNFGKVILNYRETVMKGVYESLTQRGLLQ